MVLGTVVFQDHFDIFYVHPSLIALQEVGKRHFPSFRRKPGAGVTTCHEIIFFS
jgi:hypothetical protein